MTSGIPVKTPAASFAPAARGSRALRAAEAARGKRASTQDATNANRMVLQRCGDQPCDCPAEHLATAMPLQLLALQRTAGNAAIASMLRPRARSPMATVAPVTVARVTDAEVIAAGAGQPDWRASLQVLNLILHQRFPAEEQRLYSGASVHPAAVRVAADVARGRDGRVLLVVGPDFGKSTTAATLPTRVAEVRAALVQAMLWRLSTGWLTSEDLAFGEVSSALRASPPAALRRLLAAPGVDQTARATVTQLLAISTPVGAAAALQADGSATETAGGITVRLLPDRRDGTLNETKLSLVPAKVAVPPVRHEKGRVVEIQGALPGLPEVHIQTTYAATGPQATPDPITAPSGYGKGTTAADQAAGNTSLRFHEGSHGTVFLQYFRTHAYRPFRGTTGMTLGAWRAETGEFMQAHESWVRGATTASRCEVDCVGSPTIDEARAAEPGYQKVCTACQATP